MNYDERMFLAIGTHPDKWHLKFAIHSEEGEDTFYGFELKDIDKNPYEPCSTFIINDDNVYGLYKYCEAYLKIKNKLTDEN